MRSTDKIFLGIFGVCFICMIVVLCIADNNFSSLQEIHKKIDNLQGDNNLYFSAPNNPMKEGGSNPYYEGFFRDYGDGEFHPHRQALMLLLSYLGSQGERAGPSNSAPPNKEILKNLQKDR